jgi:hypothetical protein
LLCFVMLPEDGFEVVLGVLTGMMLKFFHQNIQDGRCDEGRQAGPDADIADAEVQQCQQDADRLLLVPGKDQRERQAVDVRFEGIRQRYRDLNRGVGIVALSHIEQARNAADVAEVKLVEAELAAGQRQDDGVIRRLLGKVRVVVASGLGSIASANQEEVPDLPALTASMTLSATPSTA